MESRRRIACNHHVGGEKRVMKGSDRFMIVHVLNVYRYLLAGYEGRIGYTIPFGLQAYR